MKILGIETSCDETAAAMLQIPSTKSQVPNPGLSSCEASRAGKSQAPNLKFQILSNIVASQVEIHQKYGGIVPEVAARQHVQSIIPVIQEALFLRYKLQDLSRAKSRDTSYKQIPIAKFQKPDLIAVTVGPGLITSLQVGIQTAKTLSYVWNVPLVGVNHLEAHLWSFLLNSKFPASPVGRQITNYKLQNPELESRIADCELRFPAIGLVISGGHTEMVLVKGISKYQLIGRTRDDAVGEAFDKVAKLLNLGYPGGPIISHYAKEGKPTKIDFPRPMIESDNYDFSFSGIKTAVKYYLKDLVPTGQLSQAMIKDICASFQQAVIEVLTYKVIKAAKEFKAKSIILGGGVSANEELISNFKLLISNLGIDFSYPEKEFTGDNAAMVALAGYFNLPTLKLPPPPFHFAQWLWRTGRQAGQKRGRKDNWQKLVAEPNLKLID